MITSIRGTCQAKRSDALVVEVGGVGLLAQVTAATAAAARVGEQVYLLTTLIIREDAWTLYGFSQPSERELFELLQSVSGIGPRLALAAVAHCGAENLANYLAHGNVAALTQVPGVGKKTAERLILELREKVPTVLGVDTVQRPVAPDAAQDTYAQVVAGLVSLGWQTRDAETVVAAILAQHEQAKQPPPEVSVLLRLSLKQLNRV